MTLSIEEAQAGARVLPALNAPGIQVHTVPLCAATAETLQGYGTLEPSFREAVVEIVPWPAQGWRRIEPGTGDQGGVTEGEFAIYRSGSLLFAHNHAVDGHYVTGWFDDPANASEQTEPADTSAIYTAEANYHPDGSQLFFPRDGAAFIALLALPGDDVTPEDFVAFYCDGSFGLHIHPGVWHQPVFPLAPRAVFDDKQGRVHACVAVDFVREFQTYLRVPLARP